ncbi:hypothetical protein BJX99DRAFT_264771 [Aspergillus californicus]
MALTLLPYQHQHYDTIPDIMDAGRDVQRSGTLDTLDATIGQLFIKHGLERELGLILLHNYFPLNEAERLVQFGNAAIPWDTTSAGSELGNIITSSWRFVSDGLAPYEFRYSNPTRGPLFKLSLEKHEAFLDELRAALTKANLIDILGLCTLDEQDINAPPTIEFTSGRANITLDVDIDWDPSEEGGYIEAIWQFGSTRGSSGEPVVFKKHKTSCKTRPEGHRSIHQTTRK